MKIEEIEIADDCKYILIIEDKDMILKDADLHGISKVLKRWWDGKEKFVVLAEWGNINIKFKRAEKT